MMLEYNEDRGERVAFGKRTRHSAGVWVCGFGALAEHSAWKYARDMIQ